MKTLKTILKTNLLGVFALIAAFGLVLSMSAFTPAETKRDTYTYYYDGPFPATVSDVEDVENWKHDAETEECGGELQMACSITIDENYVDDTNPSEPILESSADLQATAFGTDAAYVTASADGSATIVNRLQ